ncbi:MAG: hypothetical protein II312_09410 [Lachnospiraceae bacterium]|nr:hypothetical protein [Lachnospiraceae bacterium]
MRIGYAARLVKQQKRADLLVDLIECLEQKKIDYVFNIAGGENGYICEVGDLSEMSDCIVELAQNRQKLEQYGMKSRKIIAERHNPSRYIDFLTEQMI